MIAPSRRNALTHFQHWSSRYEHSWLQARFFAPAQQAVWETMERYTPIQPGMVLDIGSGTGRLLRSLHEHWPDAHLLGIDPTAGMVEVARQLTPMATFEVGFAEALPFSESSIDVAVSTFSLHHWSNQAAGLREIVRVLRPQGCFFLTDVMLPPWLSPFLPWSHFRKPAQIKTLFQQAGLHILHQQATVHNHALITVGRKAEDA